MTKCTQQCHLCNLGAIEYACHLLFQCPSTSTLRCRLWQHVLVSMPERMKIEVEIMSSIDKMQFILCGLNSPFTYEYIPIYIAVTDFVSTLYEHRRPK